MAEREELAGDLAEYARFLGRMTTLGAPVVPRLDSLPTTAAAVARGGRGRA